MTEEGVIKFDFFCEDDQDVIPEKLFHEVNPVRNKLAELELIGQYPDGLSYGNISIKDNNTKDFYITASDTGKIKTTGKEHYVRIVSCNTDNNFCKFRGKGLPSSETLTHFIIYELSKEVRSVIHVHNKELWDNLKGKVPSTSESAGYGTVKMVKEVSLLFGQGRVQQEKLLVMKGHEEGVVCFGGSATEAMKILTKAMEGVSRRLL